MTEEEKQYLGELMARVSSGDETARETIAQKYYRMIYCFIFSIVRSVEDAQDLTQETFLRLCRHDFSVKVWTNCYVYIFQIAKNLCLDRFRKLKKDENIFGLETEKAERLIWDGLNELDDIFGCLSEFEERLVILRYAKGYCVNEIAKRTGIPQRTLERRFRDIKEKIKKSIQEAENER